MDFFAKKAFDMSEKKKRSVTGVMASLRKKWVNFLICFSMAAAWFSTPLIWES
jgi:hypothetical protein